MTADLSKTQHHSYNTVTPHYNVSGKCAKVVDKFTSMIRGKAQIWRAIRAPSTSPGSREEPPARGTATALASPEESVCSMLSPGRAALRRISAIGRVRRDTT